MYIPKINLATDKAEIIAFMKQFSFATIISSKDNLPQATYLPFLVEEREGRTLLSSHFAKANNHWTDIENNTVLVIFSEPHAYISPKHYDNLLEVPTWNYIAIHAYGKCRLITETDAKFKLLESTIENFEIEYKQQWDSLPQDFKLNLLKGIVAFEVEVTDLQGKKKLSQNKTRIEQDRIIDTLSKSSHSNEKMIADYMKNN